MGHKATFLGSGPGVRFTIESGHPGFMSTRPIICNFMFLARVDQCAPRPKASPLEFDPPPAPKNAIDRSMAGVDRSATLSDRAIVAKIGVR